MYINDNSIAHNIWLQLKWKLLVHQGKLWALVIIQLSFAMMLGSSSSDVSFDLYAIKGDYVVPSLDAYVVAGAIYMFIIGIYIGMGDTLKENFTIPTTRPLASISNSLYLLVISLVTTLVSFSSLYIIVAFRTIFQQQTIIDIHHLFSGSHFIGMFVLMWLVSSISYLLASLSQVHWLISIIVLIATWFLVMVQFLFFERAYEWMTSGTIYLFSIKCFLAALLFHCFTIIITAKLEVK